MAFVFEDIEAQEAPKPPRFVFVEDMPAPNIAPTKDVAPQRFVFVDDTPSTEISPPQAVDATRKGIVKPLSPDMEAYQKAYEAGNEITYQPKTLTPPPDKNMGGVYAGQQPTGIPKLTLKGIKDVGVGMGKQVVATGEAAANVASGIPGFVVDTGIAVGAGYGTLLKGGSIDEAAKNITDMQEFVTPYVVYQPQTEAGKQAVENIGKGLHWLIGRPSEIAGESIQKGVEGVGLGKTAGAAAGAGIQTLTELAGFMALFGSIDIAGNKILGIKEPIRTRPLTDKDVIDFDNFIKDEAAKLKGKKLNLDDVLEALRGREASTEAYDYIKILPAAERAQLAKSILRGKGSQEGPSPQPELKAINRGSSLPTTQTLDELVNKLERNEPLTSTERQSLTEQLKKANEGEAKAATSLLGDKPIVDMEVDKFDISTPVEGVKPTDRFDISTSSADRRQDYGRRDTIQKLIETGDIEGAHKVVYEDPLTGLLNNRAWQEAEAQAKDKVIASMDVSGLGWINDNFGHASGDALLTAVADTLKENNIEAYRKGIGDEMAGIFDNQQNADILLSKAQKTLANKVLEVTTPDGVKYKIKGWRLDYGTGNDFKTADTNLYAGRKEQVIAGLRSDTKGAKPLGLVETVSEGVNTQDIRRPDNALKGEVTPSSEQPQVEPIKKVKDVLQLTPSQRTTLEIVKKEIEAGEAGRRHTVRDDEGYTTGQNVAIPSSFPDYFQNKGYTKAESLSVIEKALNGKPLTKRQQILVEDLNQGYRELTAKNIKTMRQTVDIPSENLNKGDTIERHGETYTVKGVDDDGRVTIKNKEEFNVFGGESIKADRGSFTLAEAKPVAELIKDLNDAIGDKGAIGGEGGADVAKAVPILIDIGKTVYADGHQTYVQFRNQIKETLGATYDKVKNIMLKIWEMVRQYMKEFQPGLSIKDVSKGKPAAPFFSQLQQLLEQKMPNKADVQTIRNIIREAKQDEIKWSGIEDFLQGKDTVNKQELLDYLKTNQVVIKEVVRGGEKEKLTRADILSVTEEETNFGKRWVVEFNTGQQFLGNAGLTRERVINDAIEKNINAKGMTTKFSQYQTPGGENYRELLLTLPIENSKKITEMSRLKNEVGNYGKSTLEYKTRQERIAKLQAETEGISSFKSPHFDEPNILAHVRMNDRIDVEGEKVLFIEEIQSDWHQEGRKKGYKTEPEFTPEENELRRLNSLTWQNKEWTPEQRTRAEELQKTVGISIQEKINRFNKGVPTAPFSKTWHELALKRMLRYAADNGYDKVAWTTGEMQAERYDLSKQIDFLQARREPNGNYYVQAKRGDAVVIDRGVASPNLEETVGKDLAQKISAQGDGWNKYSGLDLKVGGEGMKGFYDKIIPDFLNKYGKKWGARVERTNIDTGIPTAEEDNTEKLAVPSIDITPSMKTEVLEKGQMLFTGIPIPEMVRALKDLHNMGKKSAAYSQLVDISNQVYADGATTFHEFTAKMKATLGDLWEKFKHLAEKLYRAAKAFNERLGERGSVSNKEGKSDLSLEMQNPKSEGEKGVDSLLERFGLKLNPDVKNKIKNDINLVNNKVNTPAYIADTHKEFKPVFEAGRQIYRDRDITISDLVSRELIYHELPNTQKVKVDKALEAGRLQRKVWNNIELKLKFGLNTEGVAGYYSMRDKYARALQTIKEAYISLGVDSVKIDEAFKGLTGYIPLTRFGEWRVINREQGSVEHYESKNEAYRRANDLNRQYPKQIKLDGKLEPAVIVDRVVKSGTEGIFDGLDPGTLSLFAHIADINPDISNPFIQAAQDYFKTLGFKSHFIEAKNTPGYSTDWSRVHASYTVSLANYLARIKNIPVMQERLKNIDKERQPILHKYAVDFIDYLSQPKEEAGSLRAGLFLYFMALNPKSAALNLTQTMTTTIPYLGQYSPWASVKATAVMKDIVGAISIKNGKPFFNHDKLGREGEALKLAEREGVVNEQMVYEMMGQARGDILAKEKLKVARALVYMFSTAETFNRRVVFLTAYRIGKQLEAKGNLPAEFKDVQTFAEKAVDNTQFAYGKFNRPRIARGKVGATFFTFKMFTLSYLEMLTKMANANGENIRRGQFAKALATIFVLAGAAGLPFADDIKKLIEYLTGDNYDTIARDVANDVLGDPEFGEVFMRGITRLGPLDMSGSIGLGDIIPDVDTISVLGPAGGVAQRLTKSMPYLKRKEYLRALETVAPEMIKNPLAAVRIAREGHRNKRGELIFSGEGRFSKEVNVGLKALSFQPSDLSRAYERERAQGMIGGKRAENKQVFVDRWAKAHVTDNQKEKEIIGKEIEDYNKGKSTEDKIFITPEDRSAAVQRLKMAEDVSGLKHTPKQEKTEYLRLKELFR